jgi:general secretion pathway protein C
MVPVDQLLKKNFWIVLLPMVSAAAFLHAQAVGELVGVTLSPDEKALAAAPPVAKVSTAPTAATHARSAEPILNRNPFDHVTGTLKPAPVTEDPAAPAEALDTSDPANAPRCEGVKVLIIAASSDPAWSFAAFSGTDGKSIMRRRGGDVGGKILHRVGWDRVWLENGSALCQAPLFDKAEAKSATPPSAPPPVAAAPPPAGGGKPLDPSIRQGIQKVGPNEYNVDRGVVDKIIENQAELMRSARIVPEQENGRVVGIRMMGIRPESLLGVLGMENGDRLQTINGFDMASPEKALEAYARLRTADKLTVSVNRKGQNVNLDYIIK